MQNIYKPRVLNTNFYMYCTVYSSIRMINNKLHYMYEYVQLQLNINKLNKINYLCFVYFKFLSKMLFAKTLSTLQ